MEELLPLPCPILALDRYIPHPYAISSTPSTPFTALPATPSHPLSSTPIPQAPFPLYPMSPSPLRQRPIPSLSLKVIAEEKVDGSNLGFSLTEDYTVLVQNRSHFVCSASHPQFKGLDAWLSEHTWALCQLLNPDDEILFGEWCLARHSVPYTHLPGYFIAFDIFSKRTGKFCSVDERNRRLKGLEIPIVPLVRDSALQKRTLSTIANLSNRIHQMIPDALVDSDRASRV